MYMCVYGGGMLTIQYSSLLHVFMFGNLRNRVKEEERKRETEGGRMGTDRLRKSAAQTVT